MTDIPVDESAPRPRRETRGRPADPEDIDFIDPDTNKPFKRRARVQGHDGTPYDIPPHLWKSGWDYAWWNDRVLNQPTASSEKAAIRDGGWRPVKPDERWLSDFCPPGWDKPYVERDGMLLYMRPMYLTEEARAEDTRLAYQHRADRLAATSVTGGISRDQERMPAMVLNRQGKPAAGIDIHGEMGTHRVVNR